MPNGRGIGAGGREGLFGTVSLLCSRGRASPNAEGGGQHTVTLHDGQELDDDLGARADEDLALSGLLGVVDGVERIVEDGSADHFGGIGIKSRFSNRF